MSHTKSNEITTEAMVQVKLPTCGIISNKIKFSYLMTQLRMRINWELSPFSGSCQKVVKT